MKRKLAVIVLILLGSFTLFASNTLARTITLKLGHISPTTSPMGKGADLFAKLVKEKSNGQIEVAVYPMEQLGKATAMLESTMIGNQDIFLEGQTWCERFSKAARIGMVNYAFRNREHYRKYTRSDLYREYVTKAVEDAGLIFLDTKANWERGPFRIMISKRPILGTEDLKGLRLRMWDASAARRSWEAFGVVTTVLPWTDVYLGLKQGIVEAVTSPVNLLYAMKFTEVAKYVTKTDEFPQLIRLYMNRNKFNSLDSAQQKALIDAGNEAGDYYTGLSLEAAEKDIDRVIKENNAVYIQVNLENFSKVMPPVIKQFEKENFLPAGLYDKIQALAD